MSDLFDLCMVVVQWLLDAAMTVLEHLGLGGGYLHRLFSWLSTDAVDYVAAWLAAEVLMAWTALLVALVIWMDRRVRARASGRAGPRRTGAFGLLQTHADWLKLMLRKRDGMPSAVAAGVSGTMVLAALALMPLGPWARLADPEWGLVVATGLLALSPLPMAAMAPRGQRHAELAEAAGTGVVLMLAAGSVMLIGASARSGDLVEVQASSGWGIALSPVGFLLLMAVMVWESDRMARLRVAGTAREVWPGPHSAIGTSAVAARYLALSILATLLFLGGWLGPWRDMAPWTLVKAFLLMALTSMVAGALPVGRPEDRASAVRTRWLPLATLNMVVVAAILEVMA